MTSPAFPEELGARFDVEGILGRGARGIVWAVRHRGSDQPLALKVATGPEEARALLAEWRALRDLAHPGLPAPYGFGALPERDGAWLLLERCPGTAWNRAFGAEADTPQPPAPHPLARATAGLLRVLAHLHASGLVHGDLHPGNVYVAGAGGADPIVRLLDLDVATERHRPGHVSGALAWLAPERLEGTQPTPASDLFAVGLLVGLALLGRHPFDDYPRRVPAGPRHTACWRRVPAAWRPFLEAMLAIDPAGRPSSARAALAFLEPLAGEPLPLWTPEVVGVRVRRSPRLATSPGDTELMGELLDASAPPTAAVWGPTGSGRTRWLEELAARALARGFEVAWAGGTAHAQGAVLQEWGRTLGLPVDIAAAQQEGAFDDPSNETTRRAARAAEALWQRLEGRNVLLVADDFDGCDPLSKRAITLLAARLRHRPRPGLRLVASAATPPRWAEHTVQLEPFDEEATQAYLAGVFRGVRVGREVARALHRATRGHPAALVGAVETTFRAGLLGVDGEALACRDLVALEVAAVRAGAAGSAETARGLSERARAVGHALAVARFDLRPDELAAAAGVEPLDATRGLGELVRRGLARVEHRSPAHVALTSPALRQVLRPQDETLRGAVEERLAAVARARGDEALEPAAWAHLLAAEPQRAAERAGEVLEAADRARAAGRPDEALGLLAALAQALGPEHAAAERVARARAEAALAAARPREAIDIIDKYAPADGDADWQRLRTLALFRLGRFDEAVDAARAALEDPEPPAPWRAEVRVWLAQALVFAGRIDEAREVAAEGRREIGERGEAPQGVVGGLEMASGLAAFYAGNLDEALEAFRGARGRFETCGWRIEVGRSWVNEGLVHHRRDAYDDALGAYERARAIFEELGDLRRLSTVQMNLGVVHQERGRLGEALDAYRRALALARGLDEDNLVAQVANNLGNALRAAGDLEAAEEAVRESLRCARACGRRLVVAYDHTLLGEIARLQGRWRQARTHLEAAREAFETHAGPAERAEVYLELGWLDLDEGKVEDAQRWARRAGEAAREADARDLQARADLLAGEAELEGEQDVATAVRLAQRAEDMARAIGHPDIAWHAAWLACRALRREGDLSAAGEAARRAQAALEELGRSVPAALRRRFERVPPRAAALAELGAWLDRAPAAPAGLSGNTERLARLLAINARLNTEHDVGALLEFIMDTAVLMTGAERGFLLLRDEDAEEGWVIRTARNFDRETIRNVQGKFSRSIAETVLASGEPVITIDAMEDERYREQLSVHALKLRSVLCVPLRRAGEPVGVLYLDNRFRANAFDDEDLVFMEAFADQAAIAIGNAELSAARERALAELEASRREVEALNEKLAARLEATEQELEAVRDVMEEQARALKDRHRYEDIIGESPALRQVLFMVDRVRKTDVPVVITGESGTGKELVARAIHYNGPRARRPFVAVNCGSIPEHLFESELFGHVRGAFTGAVSDKKGLFEVAHGGTLFLDEIAELPLAMQVKLLRALQSGEIQKVGSTRTVRVDVRILAATNRDLAAEVREHRFREDLYYRLNVVHIHLPPLRERREDIPLLVQAFIERNRREGLTTVRRVSPEALAMLMRGDWPGNVRQLEAVVKAASVFAASDVLRPTDFAAMPDLLGARRPAPSEGDGGFQPGMTLRELERLAIVRTLEATGGNKKRAAEMLGIDRRTLYNKLKLYGIRVERRVG